MNDTPRPFICLTCERIVGVACGEDQAPICIQGHPKTPMADIRTLFRASSDIRKQQVPDDHNRPLELLKKIQAHVMSVEPALDYQI